MDKTIHCLMQFVQHKLFDRLISLEKGKVSIIISNLRNRHRASQRLENYEIFEKDDGWLVEKIF